jgi:hypothetical protein
MYRVGYDSLKLLAQHPKTKKKSKRETTIEKSEIKVKKTEIALQNTYPFSIVQNIFFSFLTCHTLHRLPLGILKICVVPC